MDSESFRRLDVHFLAAKFTQDWVEAEQSAFDIGLDDSRPEGSSLSVVEWKIGILSAVLNLEISNERFVRLCQQHGMGDFEEVSGYPTFRENLTDLRAGLLRNASIRLLLLFEGQSPLKGSGDSLTFVRQNIFEPYFYSGWSSFEVDPRAIGSSIGNQLESEIADRALGILCVLANLDLNSDRLDDLCVQIGLHPAGPEVQLTTNEVLALTLDGMLGALTEKAQRFIDENGIGLPVAP